MKSLKAKHHRWYAFLGKNRSGEITINLMEEIGGWGVSAKSFRDDLARVGQNEPLHVHINSDGGDILQGLEIYNSLLEHDGPVRVSIGALAASIASVIAMAGDTISIASNGWLMIHNPWSVGMGDSEEFRKMADVMDSMKNSIVQAFVRQTGKSEQEISDIMDEETWMDAEMALEAGFVDSIDHAPEDVATAVNDLRAARSFALQGFSNTAAFKNSLKTNRMSKQTNNNPNGDPLPLLSGDGDDDPKVIVSNERNRVKEIMAIVNMIRKRDRLDFSAEGQRAIDEGVSPADFSRSCVFSPRFRDTGQIIGSSRPEDLPGDPGQIMGLGAQVVQSEAYQRFLAKGGILQRGESLSITIPRSIFAFRPRNAPVTTTGLTSIEKLGPIAYLALETPKVADLCGSYPTGASTVRFIQETSFTNAAAPTPEGAAKPEQVWNFTEVDANVRKIAVWSKISDEILMDQSRLAAFINLKLTWGVVLALDYQVVSGDGTGVNLLGILNTPGIQTVAKGADSDFDALHKALTKIRAIAFFEPDAYVLNPYDWEKLRLAKDSMGQYYGGGPFTSAYGQTPYPVMPDLWGKPVVVTTACPAGTAIAGTFKIAGELYPRTALTVSMTNTDQDDFIKNLNTIRAEQRAAFGVPHPLGFCSVTGLV